MNLGRLVTPNLLSGIVMATGLGSCPASAAPPVAAPPARLVTTGSPRRKPVG